MNSEFPNRTEFGSGFVGARRVFAASHVGDMLFTERSAGERCADLSLHFVGHGSATTAFAKVVTVGRQAVVVRDPVLFRGIKRLLSFANLQNEAVEVTPAVFVDCKRDSLTVAAVTVGTLPMLSDSVVRLLNRLSNVALSICLVPKQVDEHDSHQ